MTVVSGGIAEFVKMQKNNKLKTLEKVQVSSRNEKLEKQTEELLFDNGYGGFSKDGKEYKFCVNRDNKIPTIWSNRPN